VVKVVLLTALRTKGLILGGWNVWRSVFLMPDAVKLKSGHYKVLNIMFMLEIVRI